MHRITCTRFLQSLLAPARVARRSRGCGRVHLRKVITAALLLLSCPLWAASDSDGAREEADTVGVKVYFRRGYSALQPGYKGNGARMDSFVDRLFRLNADTTARLMGVDIRAYSSPDGSFELNEKLARRRAANIHQYLRERMPWLPEDLYRVQPEGINWRGLADMVRQSDMQYRDEVLRILDTAPERTFTDGRLTDSRLKQLMDLRGGRPYRYMFEHFFPALRNAGSYVVCRFERVVAEPDSGVANLTNVANLANPDSIAKVAKVADLATTDSIANSATPDSRQPFYMSLSTNMLYDVLLLPNIGAEVYLGRNISVTANWTYGWWSKNRRHRYWRAYGGDLAVRYWFGPQARRKPLTGHHAGVYATVFTYDFEFGGSGQMAGQPGGSQWNRAHYAVGAEYGFALPVAPRLNIDFTAGVGYMGGTYYDYKPMDGHYVWQKTVRRRWFGPTKLQISLVWLLGHGNRNERKGGDR